MYKIGDGLKKHITKYGLIIIGICMLSMLLCSIEYKYCKKTISFDEMFSFASSNTFFPEFSRMTQDRTWSSPANEFRVLLSVQKDERFNYKAVWINQAEDVHPPLYYALIHTVYSLIPERFSFWIGLIVSEIFIILTTIVLYSLGNMFYGDKIAALFCCAMFACSPSTINRVLFFRMYPMLLFMTTLAFWIHMKWITDDSLNKKFKWLFFLFVVNVIGALTHYYYIVFIVLLTLACTVYLLLSGKRKRILCYYLPQIVSAIVVLAVFPACINHIFYGYRGEQAFSNISDYDDVISLFKEYLQEIISEVFIDTTVMAVVILSFIGIVIVSLVKHRSQLQIHYFAIAIFVMVVSASVIIKISEKHTTRYISSAFPLLYLLLFGSLGFFVGRLFSKKTYCLLCILIVSFFICRRIVEVKPWVDHEPKSVKIAKQYADLDCIVFAGEDDWTINYQAWYEYPDLVNFFRIYYVKEPYSRDFVDERLANEEKLIVYVSNESSTEEVKSRLMDSLPQMKSFTYLYDGFDCSVYLLE